MLSDWADNEIGDEGARVLGDALKTNTTLTELNLSGVQQDHKQTQQESKAGKHNGMWCGWQATGLALKERVHWVTHSRQTER